MDFGSLVNHPTNARTLSIESRIGIFELRTVIKSIYDIIWGEQNIVISTHGLQDFGKLQVSCGYLRVNRGEVW
jgi:hypothetical protein